MGRMTKDIINDIAETQSSIIGELRKTRSAPILQKNHLLDAVIKCENVEAMLGNAGNIIKNYATQVFLHHPEVAFDLRQWEMLSKDVFQALAGSEEHKNKVNNDHKSILKKMSFPKPRLVQDPLRRNNMRDEKKVIKHVGLKQVYMIGENGFYSKPENFKIYVRGNNLYEKEISNLEKQKKIFSSKNMPEVSHTVGRRIKLIEEMRDGREHGFFRMKPTDAAVVSARMVGLKWHELHFITVPFKFFHREFWSLTEKKEEDKQKDEMKRLLVMKDRKMALLDGVAFSYQPRLYPLHQFGPLPNSVTEIISTIESELNGCPVFDYYWILVPSININHPYFRNKDEWKVCVNGVQTFNNEYEAAKTLDTALVSEGYFSPVVLGERDGKCYFVCLW